MSDASGQTERDSGSVVGERRRSWFARHKLLTLVGVVLLLGFLGSRKENSAGRQADPGVSTSSAASGNTVSEATKPEIVVTAIELSQAFKENEIRANQTFKGKLAEIHGEVLNVDQIFGQTIVTLKGAPWSPVIGCAFRSRAADERIVALNEGTEVALVGTIHGKSLGVNVKKCSFVSAE